MEAQNEENGVPQAEENGNGGDEGEGSGDPFLTLSHRKLDFHVRCPKRFGRVVRLSAFGPPPTPCGSKLSRTQPQIWFLCKFPCQRARASVQNFIAFPHQKTPDSFPFLEGPCGWKQLFWFFLNLYSRKMLSFFFYKKVEV